MTRIFSYTGRRSIWFMGSSIVYWANRNASGRPGGLSLNLQHIGGSVSWFGKRGMIWGDFRPTFDRLLGSRPPPDFVLIQLGSNDLGSVTSVNLIHNIEIDLLRLHMLLPQTKIIWSEILQRRYWHTAISGKAVEKSRKRVNLAVRNIVSSIQGYAIRHQNISAKEINLYRYDGTHLSDIGLRVYLNTIQGALESFLKTAGPQVFPPTE